MSGPEPPGVGIDLVRLRAGIEASIELLPIGPEYSSPVSRVFAGLEWRDICESLVNDVWNQVTRAERWPEAREHLERVRHVIDWALHETDLPPEVPEEYSQRFATRQQFLQVEYNSQLRDYLKEQKEAKRDAKK